jgi:imidazolonepropionase-like amidohydrolase
LSATTRIEAELLVPGRGDPVRDGTVVLDGPVISYAGPSAQAPPTPHATVVRAPAVLPGLWDCHTHLLGLTRLDFGLLPQVPVALRAARCTADLRAALDAGITSVREVGGIGVYLAQAVAEGTIQGPAIYAAGAVLSTTGGHGDLHSYPLGWVDEYGKAGAEIRVCDGPAECARATREQLRRNAKVIKVCASGGVLSEVDPVEHQQFTVAELRAIVEVAGMAERIVAAHCHGKPGIMAALEAGVRTIEHGTFLDDESADAMRETGAVLVTTRTIVHEILDSRAVPDFVLPKIEAVADRHASAIQLARERGVTIAMGTDLAVSGADRPGGWGRNGREIPLLLRLGFTPLQVIEMSTATGPQTLGPQAPRSGQLREGFDADVITVDGDPLTELTLLADPVRIIGVWRAGQRVKV